MNSTAQDNIILTAKNIGFKGNSGNCIISSADFNIHKGGNVILGHNGAGKTTLLNIIAGLNRPDEGHISLARNYTTRDIGYVFQKPILLKRSVEKNLAFIDSVRTAEKPALSCTELLYRLELQSKLHCPATKLSGGQQQKLAIIMALMMNPKILILDEPTASIDIKTERIIEELLCDLKLNQGLHLILTTHIISQAKKLSDYIIYLHEGSVMEISSNSDFFNNPTSPESRQYLRYFLQ